MLKKTRLIYIPFTPRAARLFGAPRYNLNAGGTGFYKSSCASACPAASAGTDMYVRCMRANADMAGCALGTLAPYGLYDCSQGDYITISGPTGMDVREPPNAMRHSLIGVDTSICGRAYTDENFCKCEAVRGAM